MCNVAHNSRARRRFFCVLFLYAQPTCNDLALFDEVHRVQMRTDMAFCRSHRREVTSSLGAGVFVVEEFYNKRDTKVAPFPLHAVVVSIAGIQLHRL